jgi:dihydrofolate reductase / thymidylate synthase
MAPSGFYMVVGMAGKTRGIGKDGQLPWTIKSDMKHFKDVTLAGATVPSTKCNAVIMGRKTWESIPQKFRPLPGRINVVLTSNPTFKADNNAGDDVITATSLTGAMDTLSSRDNVAKVFVIGGQKLFEEGLESPRCEGLFVTAIENEIAGCDTFFPVIPADRFRMSSRSAAETEGDFTFRFVEYESLPEQLGAKTEIGTVVTSDIWDMNPNQEECQYLRAIDDIIKTGTRRGDRTGVGTISKFGMQMRYSLRNNVLPLLTTKRVFWRGLAEELLWFIKGSTNANELAERGSCIC